MATEVKTVVVEDAVLKTFKPGRVYTRDDVRNRCKTYQGVDLSDDAIKKALASLLGRGRIKSSGVSSNNRQYTIYKLAKHGE